MSFDSVLDLVKDRPHSHYILEHSLVQEQLSDQTFESVDRELQFAATAISVDGLGVMFLPPPVVSRLGETTLATDIRDVQASG